MGSRPLWPTTRRLMQEWVTNVQARPGWCQSSSIGVATAITISETQDAVPIFCDALIRMDRSGLMLMGWVLIR